MQENANLNADENTATEVAVSEHESKKFRFFDLIPKFMPYLALATAALSLLFVFLIGSDNGFSTTYIYYFFGGAQSDISSLAVGESAKSAMYTAANLRLAIAVIGLVCVLALAGFTVYGAVKKFALKKQGAVEKFSVYTYFAYLVFAAMHLASVRAEGVTYNAATIAGLVLTTVCACAYFVCKTLCEREKFRQKRACINFGFALLRIALLAAIIILTTCPVNVLTVESMSVKVNGGFLHFIDAGATQPAIEDKIGLLTSAASLGSISFVAIAALYAVLIVKKSFTLFEEKKNDSVFFGVGFAVTIVVIMFAALIGGYYLDIIGVTKANTEIIKANKELPSGVDPADLISYGLNLGIPIAICVLAVAAFAFAFAQPALTSLLEKKRKAEKEEEFQGENLLEVKNLCKYFVVGKDFFGRPNKYLKAVDGVSFNLKKGTTLGIVGESGCGKSTMGRSVLRLHDITSGEVWYKGKKISSLKNREFDKLRPNMQMIFQDPYSSLSPRLTVGDIIGEAARQHKLVNKKNYHDYVLDVMKQCGLQSHYYERYPHEFSGGQRQRICIARALALKPELVVCDEPVSALDVSIQAQIINMLIDLKETLGLTYIFISHDLSVVKHISDDVGVMYLGNMVEYGSKKQVFENTLHPYTKALFSAVPVPNPHVKMNRIVLKGDIPSPVNPPKGCKFHTRCESCMEICSKVAPQYKEIEQGHFCACHLYTSDEEKERLLKEAEEAEKAELLKSEEIKKFNLKNSLKKLFGHKSSDKTQDNSGE